MVLDNLARGLHPYSLPSPGLAGLADSAAGTTRLLATQSANIRHEANSNLGGAGRGCSSGAAKGGALGAPWRHDVGLLLLSGHVRRRQGVARVSLQWIRWKSPGLPGAREWQGAAEKATHSLEPAASPPFQSNFVVTNSTGREGGEGRGGGGVSPSLQRVKLIASPSGHCTAVELSVLNPGGRHGTRHDPLLRSEGCFTSAKLARLGS